jgi:hypothetical protein
MSRSSTQWEAGPRLEATRRHAEEHPESLPSQGEAGGSGSDTPSRLRLDPRATAAHGVPADECKTEKQGCDEFLHGSSHGAP